MRLINAAGLALVKRWEGLSLTAYKDIAGVWTIGYGHTGGVQKGQQINAAQAAQLLIMDMMEACAAIELYTADIPTTDNQFAAFCSLAFNVGIAGVHASSALREHKDGDYATAAADFLLWDKAHVNGKLVTVQGLLNRRKDEAALYLMPDQVVMPAPPLPPMMPVPECA